MKGLKWRYLLASFVLLSATLSVAFLPTTAKAASEYDSIINGYTDPKGFDDDYYVQSGIFNVYDFNVRELADFVGLNDEKLNLQDVNYNDPSSGTFTPCSNEQRLNAASSLRNGKFFAYSMDYYMSSSGVRELTSVQFVTFNNSELLTTLEYNTSIATWNSRGVYKGGFIKGDPQGYTQISLSANGSSGFNLRCTAPTNDMPSYPWGVSSLNPSTFIMGYLYDSWYPSDTSLYTGHYLNYMPNNVVVQYPSGYEGEGIPDFPPISETPVEKVRPHILVDVADKSVSIRSNKNETIYSEVPDYKIYWFISNTSFDGEGSSCDPPFSTSGYSLPDGTLTFQAPCYGNYSINAYFAYDNGEFPIGGIEGLTIVETTINVNINGGYFSIDTDRGDFECNENNFCEDTQYDWEDKPCDLFNLGGCVENIFHYIGELLGINPSLTNPTGSPFVSFQTDNHGLIAVVAAPIGALHTLTVTTCSPIVLPLPFVNRNITLPCYYSLYQTHFGYAFTLYQTIAFGIISYYVIVGLLHTMKDFKDPKKDQIEVLHL